MKLYRGIRLKEFALLSEGDTNFIQENWQHILQKRAEGDLAYSNDLNETIVKLHKLSKLTYQHFTDRKSIAEKYARQNNGLLIEVELSEADILKNFTLEFQNYRYRRQFFEIVYIIRGDTLARNVKKWNLHIDKMPIIH